MGAKRDDLRRAVGRALRSVRQGWRLSLDDVEQASATLGVRITRSHLSRVENGQADLALPRFLSLMRAVGEPVAEVAESLDVLLDAGSEHPPERLARALDLLGRGEPAAAAPLFRQSMRAVDGSVPRDVLEAWARSEAALGRWKAAARALRLALAPLSDTVPELLLQLATATLGAGQPGVALPLARAAAGDCALPALLIECASLLERDRAAAGDRFAGVDRLVDGAPPPWCTLTLIVKSEYFRRGGQLRSAVRFAKRAAETAEDPVLTVEACLALGRAAGDAGRPGPGLAALERARTRARTLACPDLVALCHRESERLWKLDGDREAARQALRAARAIWRRLATDRHAPRGLPLHALFRLAAGRASGVAGNETT